MISIIIITANLPSPRKYITILNKPYMRKTIGEVSVKYNSLVQNYQRLQQSQKRKRRKNVTADKSVHN